MAVVGAMTLWGLGTAFFLFPLLELPRFLYTAATSLLSVELAALLVHSFGSEGCDPSRCPILAEAAGTVASQDVPALAGLVYVLAIGHGIRSRLTTRSR